MLITEDAFRRIELALKAEVEWDNLNDTVAKEKVIVALPPNTDWFAKQDFLNGLRPLLDPDFHLYVYMIDTHTVVESMILKNWLEAHKQPF